MIGCANVARQLVLVMAQLARVCCPLQPCTVEEMLARINCTIRTQIADCMIRNNCFHAALGTTLTSVALGDLFSLAIVLCFKPFGCDILI